MLITTINGRSRLPKVGLCTGTRHRCRVAEEDLHL
jgi:hypothetical protein